MTRQYFARRIAGLALVLSVSTIPTASGQPPAVMRARIPLSGVTIPSNPAVSPGVPAAPGSTGPMGYGGLAAFGGMLLPYGGGYNYGGYDPRVASVPSAAYFTYGNTSYTTESPSPLPVYAPRAPFAALPPPLPLTALLQVQVSHDAEIWLDGQKMRSTGARRHYRSPPLDPAKGFAYEVRARWKVEDKTVEDVRHVAIRAGATVLVDFTHLDPLVPRPSAPPPPAPSKPATDSANTGS